MVVGRGAVRTVVARVLDAEGAPVPRADLRIGTLEASGSYDRTLLLRTDSDGLARGQVWLPPAPAQMLIVGGFMPPEGDTPWAYDSLFVTGEAS